MARKCPMCGTEMVEECSVRVKGSPMLLMLVKRIDKRHTGNIGDIHGAVCPRCGEVSLYIEKERLEKYVTPYVNIEDK